MEGTGVSPGGGFPYRPTRAEIDLGNIRHNVRTFVDLVGPSCRVMAVVKADAYGHGAVEVSRAALEAGASRLGVALVEEAEELREAGIDVPLHLLFEPPPEAADRVVELGLVPTVYTSRYARELSRSAASRGRLVPVHIKVDTGMHRVGVSPEGALGLAEEVCGLPGLELEGVYTHLATASEPGDPFAAEQVDRLDAVVWALRNGGLQVPLVHAAASGAALSLPRSRLDMIRLGIAMYGLLPGPAYAGTVDVRPALSLRTRIAHVFRAHQGEGVSYGLTYRCPGDTWLAVLPVGYADGLPRALSNRWEVLIGGKSYPLVGTVCMDLCMVDLGEDYYHPGEEVTVIGGWGEERVGVERMAELLGTINYEVVCAIGKRVPRVYADR
ncbi:alanine racemase [Candidatus Solincola sp.]|nr:alanine racemase [Actinomycetota bacterium]MDI7252408.1 alanine racemase [Actinomycetota bacterium]